MMLIFAGADFYAKNAEGKTPVDCMDDKPEARQLIVDALATREQAYKDLDVLRVLLKDHCIQEYIGMTKDLESMIVNYAVPCCTGDFTKQYQDAYDILNQYVSEKWESLKK